MADAHKSAVLVATSLMKRRLSGVAGTKEIASLLSHLLSEGLSAVACRVYDGIVFSSGGTVCYLPSLA